jgi:hypothetical protein
MQLKGLAAIAAIAAVLGSALTAAAAASEPVGYLYDVQVTGTHRVTFSLPSKPLRLDFAYSETATWKETYKGVRVEVRTSEYGPERIDVRMEGRGTVTGLIKYGLSGPNIKSCSWSTNQPEPGSLSVSGTPSGTGYRLGLRTGRNTSRPPLRSANCSYYEANWARFTAAGVGPGGGLATGWVDTRSLSLTVDFRTPQQSGQLGFPLNRVTAGAGFVLNLKGKTKDQSGLRKSEGTARITFVPRPS